MSLTLFDIENTLSVKTFDSVAELIDSSFKIDSINDTAGPAFFVSETVPAR